MAITFGGVYFYFLKKPSKKKGMGKRFIVGNSNFGKSFSKNMATFANLGAEVAMILGYFRGINWLSLFFLGGLV